MGKMGILVLWNQKWINKLKIWKATQEPLTSLGCLCGLWVTSSVGCLTNPTKPLPTSLGRLQSGPNLFVLVPCAKWVRASSGRLTGSVRVEDSEAGCKRLQGECLVLRKCDWSLHKVSSEALGTHTHCHCHVKIMHICWKMSLRHKTSK